MRSSLSRSSPSHSRCLQTAQAKHRGLLQTIEKTPGENTISQAFWVPLVGHADSGYSLWWLSDFHMQRYCCRAVSRDQKDTEIYFSPFIHGVPPWWKRVDGCHHSDHRPHNQQGDAMPPPSRFSHYLVTSSGLTSSTEISERITSAPPLQRYVIRCLPDHRVYQFQCSTRLSTSTANTYGLPLA